MLKETQSERKRTQCDYTLAFKLQVASEIERGDHSYKQSHRKYGIQSRSTVLGWLRKHGNLDWNQSHLHHLNQSPQQRIKELEEQLLKAQQQLEEAQLKAKLLDSIIEVAVALLRPSKRASPKPEPSLFAFENKI